jgi:Mg2+ and Co2+ transporter CorA
MVGIVLMDPTTWLFRGHYRDKSMARPTTTSDSKQAPTRETWYSDIVEISSRFLGNQPFLPGTAINLMAAVYPATVAVCAEWLKVCHFYGVVLDKVESVLVSPSHSGPIRSMIDEALKTLTRLSQYLPNWRRMVIATLEDAMPAATRLSKPASHPQDKQNDLLLDQMGPDLKRIQHNMEELQARFTRLTDRCVAEMQLQAARESLAESHNLARLSLLATIFVPLTFLSGLFSMSQDIGSLQVSFKYYFSIGILLITVALVVVRWGPNIAHKMDRWF